MRKKIKIMDILCMINCNEEVPKRIKYHSTVYRYNEAASDYYDEEDNSLFEDGFTQLDTKTFLERDVEILDEVEELSEDDSDIEKINKLMKIANNIIDKLEKLSKEN